MHDFREWRDYLNSENVQPEDWLKNVDYYTDNKNRIHISNFKNEKRDIGHFEFNKGILYFKEKDGKKIMVGDFKSEKQKNLTVDSLDKYLNISKEWADYLSSQNLDPSKWKKMANYDLMINKILLLTNSKKRKKS